MYELFLILFFTLGTGWVAMFTCCCNTPSCSCTPGTSFQVDISGIANLVCTKCTNFNGTYFLTPSATNCGGGSVSCVWKYTDTSMVAVCDPIRPCNGVCVSLIQTTPPSATTSVLITSQSVDSFNTCIGGYGGGSTPAGTTWLKSWGGVSPDCTDYTSLNMGAASSDGLCSYAAASAIVTPVP